MKVNKTLERMLVVVFENELKAYDGYKALKELILKQAFLSIPKQ